MPTSVRMAVFAVGGLLASNLLLLALILLNGMVPPMLIVGVILTALILWGLVRKHRLAWQWGRVLGLFTAVINTLIIGFAVFNEEIRFTFGWTIWLVIFQVVCLYAVFFALGRKEALAYFGFVCPECQNLTKKAANFLFTRARCRKCGHVW